MSDTLTTADLAEMCKHIRMLGEMFDNADNSREEAALRAAGAGRAAWWTDCRYHNQAAMLVAQFANDRTLAAAIEAFCDDAYPSPSRRTAYILEHMIPLNDQARAEKTALVAKTVRAA